MPSVRHTGQTTRGRKPMTKQKFNAQRVSLCKKPKCHRTRKTELQREARKQRELPMLAPNGDKRSEAMKQMDASKTQNAGILKLTAKDRAKIDKDQGLPIGKLKTPK